MLLSADNLQFGFNGGSLLENICFSLNEGDRVGLIGANGEAVAYASGALSEEGLRQGIGMILPKS